MVSILERAFFKNSKKKKDKRKGMSTPRKIPSLADAAIKNKTKKVKSNIPSVTDTMKIRNNASKQARKDDPIRTRNSFKKGRQLPYSIS